MQYLKFLLVITMSTFINAKNICSSGYEFGYMKTINNKDIYSCVQCPEDFYSNKNTKYCISCPPGHISNKGSSICELCTIEMYKNKLCKRPDKTLCPPNYYITINGCMKCSYDEYTKGFNQALNCQKYF